MKASFIRTWTFCFCQFTCDGRSYKTLYEVTCLQSQDALPAAEVLSVALINGCARRRVTQRRLVTSVNEYNSAKEWSFGHKRYKSEALRW